jgi:acyl dehydratase
MNLIAGQKATRSMTLTGKHVKDYADLTGDYNPLHFDEEYAADTSFGRSVV